MADNAALRARRKRHHKAGDHSLCRVEWCEAAGTVPTLAVLPAVPADGDLTAAYQRELEQRGLLESAQGEHVMALVRAMATGQYTGSALAVLSKELRTAMIELIRGSAGASTALDELRARRAERRGA